MTPENETTPGRLLIQVFLSRSFVSFFFFSSRQDLGLVPSVCVRYQLRPLSVSVTSFVHLSRASFIRLCPSPAASILSLPCLSCCVCLNSLVSLPPSRSPGRQTRPRPSPLAARVSAPAGRPSPTHPGAGSIYNESSSLAPELLGLATNDAVRRESQSVGVSLWPSLIPSLLLKVLFLFNWAETSQVP